jgi:hypothetical protein
MGFFARISPFGRTLIDDADASTARTTLGLGTAATQNTGTSGANVPLMNGTNTWSAAQTFSANILASSDNSMSIGNQTTNRPSAYFMAISSGSSVNASGEIRWGNSTGMLRLLSGFFDFGSAAVFRWSGGDPTGVAPDVGMLRPAAGVIAFYDNDATGNPAIGIQARSSTTNRQDRYRVASSAIDNTHASRKYAVTGSIYDTSARTVYYAWTDGSRGYYAVSAPNGTAPDSNQPNNTVCFYRNGSNELRLMYKNNSGTTTDINLGTVT